MVRKIHYVWLGKTLPPPNVKYCINSWLKFCPNYEFIKWDENNFDIDRFCWVKEAIDKKKYAFASDFIRLYVLEKYGGIYVDTDVEFLCCPEKIIKASFISGIENFHYGTHNLENINDDGIDKRTGKLIGGFGINAGFIYTEPHSPIIKDIIELEYNNGNRHFVNEDGTFNQMIIDGVLMRILHERYGLKYKDLTQKLDDNILIYNSEIISTKCSQSSKSVAIHWYDQTWNRKNKLIELLKINHPKLYRKIYYFIKHITANI